MTGNPGSPEFTKFAGSARFSVGKVNMSSIGDQTTEIVNKASTRNFDGITKFRKVKNRW